MTVLTGTDDWMSTVLMFVFSRSHAASTLIRPFPCSCAPARDGSRKRALDLSACLSWSGCLWTFDCFAALRSSAAAPVACGAAIDVPLNIE